MLPVPPCACVRARAHPWHSAATLPLRSACSCLCARSYRWDSAQIKALVQRKKEAGGGANLAFEKQNLKRHLEALQDRAERTEEEEQEIVK